jgi:hypothetical protein
MIYCPLSALMRAGVRTPLMLSNNPPNRSLGEPLLVFRADGLQQRCVFWPS